MRYKRHGDPLKVTKERYSIDSKCKADGCDNKPKGRGLCRKHLSAEVTKNAKLCVSSGCPNKAKAKGLCGRHYDIERGKTLPTCKVEDCKKPSHVLNYCNSHYLMFKKYGDPKGGKYEYKIRKAFTHPDGTRTCSLCEIRQPIGNFHKDKSATDGYRSKCKTCRGSLVKSWYEANIDRQRNRANTRRKADPEKERLREAERYIRDREKRIGLATEHSHRRKARKLQTTVEKGISVISLKKIHGTKCYYCGIEMDFGKSLNRKFKRDMATIEHIIPLARGGEHTFTNTVLACRFCNISKSAKSEEDFRGQD
jgi:5-methylcytosine-specific restriction endonuclease McrA